MSTEPKTADDYREAIARLEREIAEIKAANERIRLENAKLEGVMEGLRSVERMLAQ